MAISTLSKLYGYLKGYEVSGYTGTSKYELAESVQSLITDECEILFPDEDQNSRREITNKVFPLVDKFLTHYFARIQNVSTSAKVKDIADKSKSDYETLQSLLSLLIQGDDEAFPVRCTLVGYRGTQYNLTDICEKCPYYMKSKFVIGYALEDDIDNNLYVTNISFSIPEFRYLAQALVCLTHLLLNRPKVTCNNLKEYYMLFEHILISGKMFELMNPTNEVREDQILSTLKLLTREPLDTTNSHYQELDEVLESVFNDIREDKLPYIKDISNALKECEEFLLSDYDNEKDPYFSLKGSGQKDFTKIRYSIQSSTKEVDWYKDQFIDFDSMVGFTSYYDTRDNHPDLTLDDIKCIRTILINNPGKFKGRIIHIFDNPLQDRCNYIHRRLARLLSHLKCDCTKNQDEGRNFLRSLTMDWALTDEFDKRIGIYCGDFSNATDTLDQTFQCRVLEFVFGEKGEVISRFWKKISSMRKYIQHVDGHYEAYDQKCGQPQGCLGSFDSFSLAHYFIFLMVMKMTGRTKYPMEEFCRILGDDSVCNSINPEVDEYQEDSWIDSEGIRRSSVEEAYFDVCQNLAGFDINFSKSKSTHWDSREAKLDFAKVTFRNGDFFSPIPFRLAMNYHQSANSQLACAIWRGERGDHNAIKAMDQTLSTIDLSDLQFIVWSGVIPYLAPFKKDDIEFNSSWICRLKYAYALSLLEIIIAFASIRDHERDRHSVDTLYEAIYQLFTDKAGIKPKGICSLDHLDSLDPNHKIWTVLNQNEQILSLIKQILDQPSWDDQILAILCSPLLGDIKESTLTELINLLSLKKDVDQIDSTKDPELIATVFPDANEREFGDLSKISNSFVSRGIAKKPRDEAVMLSLVFKNLEVIEDKLGYIYPVSEWI